jgi:hypothetical protein
LFGKLPRLIERSNSPQTRESPLQFTKRSQLFIGAHDETLSVAMRVNDPDRALLTING